jgi:rSAM-associated Gly-rich repeat protein
MSDLDRRLFLKGILGTLAQAAGTAVVASAAAPTARAQGYQPKEAETTSEDVQERADRLAAACNLPAEEAEALANEFLNGAFRNTPLGGFRNTPLGGFGNGPLGGFGNGPLGNFRNGPLGGFRNTPLGAFGNGGWPNGGWGGFRNGGWPNGAWLNHGWPNWW